MLLLPSKPMLVVLREMPSHRCCCRRFSNIVCYQWFHWWWLRYDGDGDDVCSSFSFFLFALALSTNLRRSRHHFMRISLTFNLSHAHIFSEKVIYCSFEYRFSRRNCRALFLSSSSPFARLRSFSFILFACLLSLSFAFRSARVHQCMDFFPVTFFSTVFCLCR